jgi:hypothetical protein
VTINGQLTEQFDIRERSRQIWYEIAKPLVSRFIMCGIAHETAISLDVRVDQQNEHGAATIHARKQLHAPATSRNRGANKVTSRQPLEDRPQLHDSLGGRIWFTMCSASSRISATGSPDLLRLGQTFARSVLPWPEPVRRFLVYVRRRIGITLNLLSTVFILNARGCAHEWAWFVA